MSDLHADTLRFLEVARGELEQLITSVDAAT